MVDVGQPLDRVAGIEQHAGPEHGARDDGLHRGNRQPERTGTGDDENGDRGDDGVVPGRAGRRPAQHGEKRRRMHDGRIEPRGAVGEPYVAGARLHGIVEQPADLRQQRAFGRRRHPHPQGARLVERAGIDGRPRPRFHGQGFAGDQALVDLGLPFDHDAVDGGALARTQQHNVACLYRCDRHDADFIRADEFGGGLSLQCGEVAGHRARLAAHALIEIAAGQQEGEQHQRSVEIGVLGVVDRLGHRHRERQHDADRDRHVHVGVARPQGAPCRPEERLPGIGRRGQGNQRRQPVEEITLLRDHVA